VWILGSLIRQPKKSLSLPFSDEVLNTIARYEAYSFLNGYSSYHQISIAFKNRYKTTFVTNWGAFVWMVMPFGVKNGPLAFQRIIRKTFREYLDQFMKIVLDDFIVYRVIWKVI
jgi:hypothetical protein